MHRVLCIYYKWKYSTPLLGYKGASGIVHDHDILGHILYNPSHFRFYCRLFHTRLTHISSLCDPVTGSQINSVLESCAHRLVESMEDQAVTAPPHTAITAAATAAAVSQVRLLEAKLEY